MMVQTLNPCSPASKTEEILSRYRPIAPKPELTASGDGALQENSPKIRHSPYLKNIWAHLQARPTRTRKRGRGTISPAALKRHPHQRASAPLLGLSCPSPLSSPSKCLSMQGFLSPLSGGLEEKQMITLPLLSSSISSPPAIQQQQPPSTALPSLREADFIKACKVGGNLAIDLNAASADEALEEKDLVLKLQSPTNPTAHPWVSNVIAPKPIRPIGSTIRVGSINTEGPTPEEELQVAVAPKKPDEVEREVEAEALPVVISDSSNKVRMANSAYNELVGQPECPWLDNLITVAGRRISGEVMLQVSGSELPISSKGFSCWVRIEWVAKEGKKGSVDAFSDVVRLSCESKDYLFSWRFHPTEASPYMSKV